MLELTMRLQEAEKNNLRAKSKKNMSLQDKQKKTLRKTQILSFGDFPLRRNPWTCSN